MSLCGMREDPICPRVGERISDLRSQGNLTWEAKTNSKTKTGWWGKTSHFSVVQGIWFALCPKSQSGAGVWSERSPTWILICSASWAIVRAAPSFWLQSLFLHFFWNRRRLKSVMNIKEVTPTYFHSPDRIFKHVYFHFLVLIRYSYS